MAMRYEITGPVANGDYFTDEMDASFKACELSSIRFFDGAGVQVTPSAGTVVFSGTPDGVNYRQVVDGTFNAADAYSFERTPPYAEGLMIRARINLSGIGGAVTFSAIVWRD